MRECSGSPTPILNATEYLERLFATGITADDLPVIQPLFQSRIWQRMAPGDGPGRLATVVADLGHEDDRFHMDGGSWTSDISWVRGYDQLLPVLGDGPVDRLRRGAGPAYQPDPRARLGRHGGLTCRRGSTSPWCLTCTNRGMGRQGDPLGDRPDTALAMAVRGPGPGAPLTPAAGSRGR